MILWHEGVHRNIHIRMHAHKRVTDIYSHTMGCCTMAFEVCGICTAQELSCTSEGKAIRMHHGPSAGVCVCTLRAVICIPMGGAHGNTYNCTQGTTLEPHGMTIYVCHSFVCMHAYVYIPVHTLKVIEKLERNGRGLSMKK